jgi:hypothetical protein
MKNFFILVMLAAAAMLFAACGETGAPANTENAANENANTAAKPAEDPGAAVTELETKAYEAWKAKDAKFFEANLADDFVSNGPYTDKAGLVKRIADSPCEVKDVKLEDSKTTKLTDSAVLITSKVVADYTCGGKPGVNPQWAAGVWVKTDGGWKGAFHKSLAAADAKGEALKGEQTSPAAGTDDLTKTLSEMENKWWQEWKDKKTDYFESQTRDDFFQIGSDGRTDKATALKQSKETPCEVKSFKTDGFKATQISENVAVLTYTATQEGSCRGTAIPGKVTSVSIFVKDGDTWKGAYYMESPA